MANDAITFESCVVRNTAAVRGRTSAAGPSTTAARHLHYGRIILAEGDPAINFGTGPRETAFICLKGAARIEAGGAAFDLGPYDSLYVPRGEAVSVTASGSDCDLAEISAPVEARYPIQFVRYSDVQQDTSLHFRAGGPSAQRELNILIGNNVKAGRLLAGVTFSEPGNWTSWPPHEHAAMLEEGYLYIDMPAPAWGIQLVYTNSREPELAVVVREGDFVLMPKGYHPNVAAPGSPIKFLWMMAANREGEDRQFGVVNVQPDYAQGGSGLEPSQARK